LRQTHILVVDDEAGIRRFVGASLRAEGYEVSLATDGEEALQAVERSYLTW
jgi:CheY-like chemotaxis protein